MNTHHLLQWCTEQLQPSLFQDYAPNGLQIEGCDQISSIVAAVTASEAAIDEAIARKANVLLVHHGYFWKNEPVTITGWKKRRIEKLLAHKINLIAYHLPLDGHPLWGNNTQLGKQMGWQITRPNTPDNLLTEGVLDTQMTLAQLGEALATKLARKPVLLGESTQPIQKLAWCTGGAQSYFQAAIDLGVDCFITGEASESQFHMARESGVAFIGAGHHATEKFGIQTLAQQIGVAMDLSCYFFDEANPL